MFSENPTWEDMDIRGFVNRSDLTYTFVDSGESDHNLYANLYIDFLECGDRRKGLLFM